MVEVTEELLQEIVDRLVKAGDPEQIILFGSHARGDAAPDSDVDLLVVQAQPFGPGRPRLQAISGLYAALRGMGIAKDILLFTRAEVEHWRDSINHVVSDALREGRVLYERPAPR